MPPARKRPLHDASVPSAAIEGFSMLEVAKFTSTLSVDSRRNRFGFFLSSNPATDYLLNSPQCFCTLRHIRSKHLEDMIHAFPGLQDDLGPLAPGAVGEGLNAAVQNLAVAGLNVHGRKTAQVGRQQ